MNKRVVYAAFAAVLLFPTVALAEDVATTSPTTQPKKDEHKVVSANLAGVALSGEGGGAALAARVQPSAEAKQTDENGENAQAASPSGPRGFQLDASLQTVGGKTGVSRMNIQPRYNFAPKTDTQDSEETGKIEVTDQKYVGGSVNRNTAFDRSIGLNAHAGWDVNYALSPTVTATWVRAVEGGMNHSGDKSLWYAQARSGGKIEKCKQSGKWELCLFGGATASAGYKRVEVGAQAGANASYAITPDLSVYAGAGVEGAAALDDVGGHSYAQAGAFAGLAAGSPNPSNE
jgi:opacity protein-like surface antigen